MVDLSITLDTTRTGRDPLVSLPGWSLFRRIGSEFERAKLTTGLCQVIMTKENAAASGLCPDLVGSTPPSTTSVPVAAPTTCKRKDGQKKKRSTAGASFGEVS